MSPVDIRESLGELRAEFAEHRGEFRAFAVQTESHLSTVAAAYIEQGKAIAALQAGCPARHGLVEARIDGVCKRLSHISEEMGGVVETSQVLDAQRAAWRRVAASAWVVTRIVLLAAGALGIGGSIVAAISAAIK